MVVERGLGGCVWDIEGHRYLDWIMGFSSVNQGHCHPEIVKVMID